MVYFSADTGLKASVGYILSSPFQLLRVCLGIGLIEKMYTEPSF